MNRHLLRSHPSVSFRPIEVSFLLLSARAQKLNTWNDPVFSAAFYEPYEAAAAACMETLSIARACMPLDVLTLQYRLKSSASIRGKLRHKGLPETAAAAGAALHDIAGLRAVLSTREAVYHYADLLMSSHSFSLEDIHDYIASPKPSGYRSLHLIGRVPVLLSSGVCAVPAEIQLRTAAMDAWACAEHALIYKPRI